MQTKHYKIGATGAGADSDVFPNLLRKMFNLPMQLVSGYQSAAETVLAIQRGEVDGRCGWSWSTLSTRNRDLWLTKQIKVVLQLTDKKLAELAEVPSVLDVAASPEQQAILKLIIARQTMARPVCGAARRPGGPTDGAAQCLRSDLEGPGFPCRAKRQGLDVRPVTGAEADALIKQVYATSGCREARGRTHERGTMSEAFTQGAARCGQGAWYSIGNCCKSHFSAHSPATDPGQIARGIESLPTNRRGHELIPRGLAINDQLLLAYFAATASRANFWRPSLSVLIPSHRHQSAKLSGSI